MAIILKTKLQWKFGQTNELPFIGTTQIGIDGTIEVSNEEIANQLLEACSDLYIPGEEEEIKPKGGEGGKLEEEEEELPDQDGDKAGPLGEGSSNAGEDDDDSLSEEEKAAMIASLKLKSKKELDLMAVEFPEEEWKSLNKAQLLEYLIQKIN